MQVVSEYAGKVNIEVFRLFDNCVKSGLGEASNRFISGSD